jgi:WD40 repeat protein
MFSAPPLRGVNGDARIVPSPDGAYALVQDHVDGDHGAHPIPQPSLLVELGTGTQQTLPSFLDPCTFSDYGALLACGHQDAGDILVFDVLTGETVLELTGHDTPIEALTFLAKDTRIASFSEDGELKLWDVLDGREVLQITTSTELSRRAWRLFASDEVLCLTGVPFERSETVIFQSGRW